MKSMMSDLFSSYDEVTVMSVYNYLHSPVVVELCLIRTNPVVNMDDCVIISKYVSVLPVQTKIQLWSCKNRTGSTAFSKPSKEWSRSGPNQKVDGLLSTS